MRAIVVVGVLLAAGSASAKPGKENRWIGVDVANVRVAPKADAAVDVRLRINTYVTIAEWRDGYGRLREPSPSGKTLWVAESVLSDHVITLDEAVRAAEAATKKGDAALAANWWQRATAIDPGHTANLEKLAALLVSTNRNDEAKLIRDRLAGRAEAYVAVCEGSEALLAGKIQPDGTVVSLSGVDGAILARLGQELAAAPWFGSWTEGVRPLVGTPFARPSVGPVAAIDEEGGKVLTLGPCHDDRAAVSRVYTTVPFERLATTDGLLGADGKPFPFASAIPKAYRDDGWRAVTAEVRRIGDTGLFDARVGLEKAPSEETAVRAVLDRAGKVLPATEGAEASTRGAYRTWLRPLWRASDAIVGVTLETSTFERRFDVPPEDGTGGSSSVSIDVVVGGALRHTSITIREVGC